MGLHARLALVRMTRAGWCINHRFLLAVYFCPKEIPLKKFFFISRLLLSQPILIYIQVKSQMFFREQTKLREYGRCWMVSHFDSLSFWKVDFATCCLVLSCWKMTPVQFAKIGWFFLESHIEICELVAMLLCSLAGWKKLKANYPSAIPPNEQQHLDWT